LAKITKSVDIMVPPENVWFYVSMPENFPKWSGTLENIEIIEEKEAGIGTTVRATIGGIRLVMEVTEYVENKRVSSQAIAGDLKKLTHSFTLDPIEGGTRLTYLLDYAVPAILGGKILDVLLIRKTIDEEMERGLKRLKALLEELWLILGEATKK
jgi:uncharacterized membrane protein